MTSPGSRPTSGRLRKIVLYGASRTTAEALLAIRGVVLAGLLGPEGFGVWALFRLGMRYGAFPALGVQRGIEVEVSSDEDRASWGQAAVGYLVGMFGVLGVLCFAVSFAADPPKREVLRAMSVALLLQRLWAYGASYMRAAGQLRYYAQVEVAYAAFGLVVVCGLAYAWGFAGAVSGYVIPLALVVWLLRRRMPLRPTFDRKRLKRLFDVGLPLSLADMTGALLISIDRVVVVAVAGTEALGFYAFAVAVSGLGNAMVTVVRTVVFPDVYSAARREGGGKAAFSHLCDTLVPVARVFPPVLGAAGILLGPVVALAVPQYIEVLPVARLFIFTGMATAFTSLGTLGVVATERQRLLPWLSLAGLVANTFIALHALGAGWGLFGVALGALVSRSLTGMAIATISTIDSGIGVVGRATFDLLWPLVWCASSVYVIGRLRPEADIVTTLGSMAIYLGTLVPMMPLLVREVRRQKHF